MKKQLLIFTALSVTLALVNTAYGDTDLPTQNTDTTTSTVSENEVTAATETESGWEKAKQGTEDEVKKIEERTKSGAKKVGDETKKGWEKTKQGTENQLKKIEERTKK